MTDSDYPRYIASPCIRQCTLNDDDVCVGCGRHLEEIKQWTVVDPERQLQIINAAEQRLKNLHRR